MIATQNLSKTYKTKSGPVKAVQNLTISIEEGEIFGIIGPTGAGKTTILKMLSTLVLPDSGSATVHGYNIINQDDQVKKHIGVVVGEFTRALYWRLTAQENMEFFAKIKGINNPKEITQQLLTQLNLKEHQHKQVMKFSTGMKHKLALAIALINDPPILILDEPLTGIDPVTAYEIKQLIKNKFQNKTIIWASHNLFEIEEMCNRILLLRNGEKIIEGKVNELKKKYWNYEKIIIECDNIQPLFEIPLAQKIDTNKIEIPTQNVNDTMQLIFQIIQKNGIIIAEISTAKPSLENIFMTVIKHA